MLKQEHEVGKRHLISLRNYSNEHSIFGFNPVEEGMVSKTFSKLVPL